MKLVREFLNEAYGDEYVKRILDNSKSIIDRLRYLSTYHYHILHNKKWENGGRDEFYRQLDNSKLFYNKGGNLIPVEIVNLYKTRKPGNVRDEWIKIEMKSLIDGKKMSYTVPHIDHPGYPRTKINLIDKSKENKILKSKSHSELIDIEIDKIKKEIEKLQKKLIDLEKSKEFVSK